MEQKNFQPNVRRVNLDKTLELKKRRRKVFYIKASIVLFIGLFIFIGLIFLSRIKALNIKDISVSGNKVLETESIASVVNKELEGNYLFFFPKSNAFLYPKNKIKKNIPNNFHRIENFSISRSGFNKLNIVISERTPAFLWCGFNFVTSADRPSPDSCYFLDDSGFVFDHAPYFSGSAYFKFYGAKDFVSGIDPIGKNIIQKDQFKILVMMNNEIVKLGLVPEAFIIRQDDVNNEAEFILSRPKTLPENRPRIIFKLTDDLNQVVVNLKSALENEPLKTDIKEKYSTLRYLDLRYSDKVYFKF